MKFSLLITLIFGFLEFGLVMDYTKISLNGTWELEPAEQQPEKYNYVVPVPGLVDLAEPLLKWDNYKYFWYRKSFFLPNQGSDSRIFLQLEQVKYGTQVWLNGQFVGEDIPAYTSQEFDLTPFVQWGKPNELTIRVGTKSTLPEESAVGNDFEKLSFIPGIWGDVWLHFYGKARIQWTRIIPDIGNEIIRIHSEVENFSTGSYPLQLLYRVIEKKNKRPVTRWNDLSFTIQGGEIYPLDFNIEIPQPELWSPENPFLYTLELKLVYNNQLYHKQEINFGMREFKIVDGDFYLNGKRRVLFGSNIAFHRMLSDPTRGNLPWKPDWIKKALVDIPRAHNMFFFRFHLGHAYNRWYDIADENGIMLQDEWMFWTPTGSAKQIEKEFVAWIKENINHPSIVIWDALNESQDSVITNVIIPKLKHLDPTRPWELVDFEEDHPYIYSLGPVLNGTKFGYSRSIFELEKSPTPTMVNEYIWWWLDRNGDPTPLTQKVIERWLGRNPDKEQIIERQSFLASELTELWRRLDLDAIMPFVYLSVGEGATGNWFWGPLSELRPKPILSALKNAFSPLGVSIELWDRHFVTGEKREIPVYLFNDTLTDTEVQLKVSLKNQEDIPLFQAMYALKSGEHKKVPVEIELNFPPGSYELIATVSTRGEEIAHSRKKLFVFPEFRLPSPPEIPSISLIDPIGEIETYFKYRNVPFRSIRNGLKNTDLLLIYSSFPKNYPQDYLTEITEFVNDGGILVLQEPAYQVKQEKQFNILKDLELYIQYRKDPEQGGYDSYVFPEDTNHFLWRGILPEHLQIFNGALGGEIVSQHNVRLSQPYNPVASCNLSLKVPAVMEIPYGKGWVIISRIQVRGRLLPEKSSQDLYGRRYDPVAERYFWNLLTGYISQDDYHAQIKSKLDSIPIYIANIKASSGQIYDALDGKMSTRWSSKAEDPQWVWVDFGRPTMLNELIIYWEVAFGKEYEILASQDGKKWQSIFKETNSDGGKDVIRFDSLKTRYLKINFQKRGTQWGYSIWEMQFK